jgi:hypothetical protein
MKNYNVNSIQPRVNQLYSLLDQKLSAEAKKSVAFYAVCHLFESAEALYRTLGFYTNEQLAIFKTAGRYLTSEQEHDLIALTAHYTAAINTIWIQRIVNQDQTLSDMDRIVLKSALDLYKTTTDATCAALGSPQWLDP